MKVAKLPTVPRMPRFEIVLDHSKKKNPFFHDASTCTVSLFSSGKCLVKGAAGTCIALMFAFLLLFFFLKKKNFKPILILLPEQSDLLPSPFYDWKWHSFLSNKGIKLLLC